MLKNYFNFMYSFFFLYGTPSMMGVLWNWGVLSLMFFILQFMTGIFISMHFVADANLAFNTVEDLMRNMEYGWMLSYLHANGASFFFLCVFIHMFSNLYYNSYLSPSEYVWSIGMMMFILMIMTAFTGYVLPWGQMSFWAATVITNLFSAMPLVGDFMTIWLWGGYSVNTATLNSFFSFHFMLPFILMFLMIMHMIFLHDFGSTNKLNLVMKQDKIYFGPYFTIKDLLVMVMFLLFFINFFGFFPNYLGHPDNYIMADSLVTPAHMVPEWYFLLFYAMLRSMPSKLGGVLMLAFSLVMLLIFHFFLKLIMFKRFWLNEKFIYIKELINEKVNLLEMNLIENFMIFNFWMFLIDCIMLSMMGSKPMEDPYLFYGSILTFNYFWYFFYLLYNFFMLSYMKLNLNFYNLNKYKYYLMFNNNNFYLNIINKYNINKIKFLNFLHNLFFNIKNKM